MGTRTLRSGAKVRIGVATKKCARCKKELEASKFPIDQRSKDNLWRLCRKCESKRKKRYREEKAKKSN